MLGGEVLHRQAKGGVAAEVVLVQQGEQHRRDEAKGRLAWTRGGRRLRSLLVQPSGADLRTLAAWMASGEVGAVIERTYPLEEAAQAQLRSPTGRVRGKLVLVVDEHLASLVVRSDGHEAARA